MKVHNSQGRAFLHFSGNLLTNENTLCGFGHTALESIRSVDTACLLKQEVTFAAKEGTFTSKAGVPPLFSVLFCSADITLL